MDTIVFPPGLYDRLLESVRFDDPEEVLQRIEHHLSLSPGHAKKTKRMLSHLLAPIVQLRKYNLLDSLTPTLLKHGVVLARSLLKMDGRISYLMRVGETTTVMTNTVLFSEILAKH